MNDEVVNAIEIAMNLSNMFESIRGNERVSTNDFKIDYILPYLFFNPKKFDLFDTNIRTISQYVFRLNSMRELNDCNLNGSESLELLFEQCSTPISRLAFLKNDLELITQGKKPNALYLSQFEQYISDILPILYSKFSRFFPMETFITALFDDIGDSAILTMCFTFPHFIVPVFKQALKRDCHPFLLTNIAALSIAHRPILHQHLTKFHKIYSYLAIRFFPEESPALIVAAIPRGIRGLKKELYKLFVEAHNPKSPKKGKLSAEFYLCYARCCATEQNIDEKSDTEVLKTCPDDKLLLALLFLVEISSRSCGEFINKFQQNPSSMATLYEYYTWINNNKFNMRDKIAEEIASVLGSEYEYSGGTSSFYVYVRKSLDTLDKSVINFGTGARALTILGGMIDEVGAIEATQNHLPKILITLEKVDVACLNAIKNYSEKLAKEINPNSKDSFSNVMDILLSSNPFFDPEKIAENPCPAVALTVIMLNTEGYIQARGGTLRQLNYLPLRYVLSSCSINENCKSIFINLCSKCAKYIYNQFSQPIHMTESPSELLESHVSQLEMIEKLRTEEIDEEFYNLWTKGRFFENFDFVLATISALDGVTKFDQPHLAFNFPPCVYRNKWKLKIICVCLLDIIAFYDKFEIPQRRVQTTNYSMSVYLILTKAIDLLHDSQVDSGIICSFINDILTRPAGDSQQLLNAILSQEIDSDLINTITHKVKVLTAFWRMFEAKFNDKDLVRSKVFLFEFMTHLAEVDSNNKNAFGVLHTVITYFKGYFTHVTEDNLQQILDSIIRLYKIYPSLQIDSEEALHRIHAIVQEAYGSKPYMLSLVDLALDRITSFAFDTTISSIQ